MCREDDSVGFELLVSADDGHVRECLVVKVTVKVRLSYLANFFRGTFNETHSCNEPRDVPRGLFIVAIGVSDTGSP